MAWRRVEKGLTEEETRVIKKLELFAKRENRVYLNRLVN